MGITPTQGAALEDAGNGTAQDYGVPNRFNENSDVGAESNFNLNQPKENVTPVVPQKEPKPDEENPYNEPPTLPAKPKDDKKVQDVPKNPADKPKQPKAAMPKKGAK